MFSCGWVHVFWGWVLSTWVLVLVDARDWHWVSSSINGVPLYLLRQGLSQNLELVQLAILASQLALGFLSLLSTGYQMGYYSCLHFDDGARYKTLVLMLCRSTPCTEPSPSFSVFWSVRIVPTISTCSPNLVSDMLLIIFILLYKKSYSLTVYLCPALTNTRLSFMAPIPHNSDTDICHHSYLLSYLQVCFFILSYYCMYLGLGYVGPWIAYTEIRGNPSGALLLWVLESELKLAVLCGKLFHLLR